jgi:hypothetical protein
MPLWGVCGEQTAVRHARPEKLLINLSEQQKVGADDGNRTRMTSLEGFGCGGSDQRLRRSAACPLIRE